MPTSPARFGVERRYGAGPTRNIPDAPVAWACLNPSTFRVKCDKEEHQSREARRDRARQPPSATRARGGGSNGHRNGPEFGTLVWRLQYCGAVHAGDRKSTRLNSSHANISYAVFCLKKKKET